MEYQGCATRYDALHSNCTTTITFVVLSTSSLFLAPSYFKHSRHHERQPIDSRVYCHRHRPPAHISISISISDKECTAALSSRGGRPRRRAVRERHPPPVGSAGDRSWQDGRLHTPCSGRWLVHIVHSRPQRGHVRVVLLRADPVARGGYAPVSVFVVLSPGTPCSVRQALIRGFQMSLHHTTK